MGRAGIDVTSLLVWVETGTRDVRRFFDRLDNQRLVAVQGVTFGTKNIHGRVTGHDSVVVRL